MPGKLMDFPTFSPPWWLQNAHAQTLSTTWWTGPTIPYRAIQHVVALDDGDQVILHDDCPVTWEVGGPAALLMHGLSGCHASPLLVRIGAKLNERGIRVFRWDMRGCGAGVGLARYPYHAGCSHDLARVIDTITALCNAQEGMEHRSAPFLSLFGVSLSGNILLKYLGEAPDRVNPQVLKAIAVNPPIDLARSIATLNAGVNRWYDRHFVGALMENLRQRQKLTPNAPMPATSGRPRTLYEFDDWYTAPISGFRGADHYYQSSSAAQFMGNVRVPTTVITSRDDPMVPYSMFIDTMKDWSSSIHFLAAEGGGHVGYFARRGIDRDEFWLDWRAVDLITNESTTRRSPIRDFDTRQTESACQD